MSKKDQKLPKGLIAVIGLMFLIALLSLLAFLFIPQTKPIFVVLHALTSTLLAIGLIKLSNIARIGVISLCSLGIITTLIASILGTETLMSLKLIRTIIGIAVIVYLMKPNVKSIFIKA